MSECPKCKHPYAYIGPLFVECPNKDCSFYTEKSEDEYNEYLLELEHKLNEKNKRLEKINNLASLKNNKTENRKPNNNYLSDPDKTPTYPWGSGVTSNLPLPDFTTQDYEEEEEDDFYGNDMLPLD